MSARGLNKVADFEQFDLNKTSGAAFDPQLAIERFTQEHRRVFGENPATIDEASQVFVSFAEVWGRVDPEQPLNFIERPEG